MTTLKPCQPYTDDELKKLYPAHLELQQVQILLRHGERTPVGARFKNTGLAPYWPYCTAAKQLQDTVLAGKANWDTLQWARRLETFTSTDGAAGDVPTLASGAKGEVEGICESGELTDRGRETTLALGRRIRNLYIDRLNFLPATVQPQTDADVYVRSTPIPRARESVQQAYTGLYPPTARAAGLPPKPIVSRSFADETLYPNEGGCPRFRELAAQFAARTADLYNGGAQLEYVNSKIGKWMPKESPTVKVDSHPRLSGIMDTINATRAHGPNTRLPNEFYDEKVISNIDRICTEEWFVGYQESNEYRTLGIGGLVGDLTQRMVEHVRHASSPRKPVGAGVQGGDFKLMLAGCHDTTIASTLTSLGAFDVAKDTWPNFTSNIAFELFRKAGGASASPSTPPAMSGVQQKSWLSSLFTSAAKVATAAPSAREPLSDLPSEEREKLSGYFVRLRYNDKPITLPYCAKAGRHLEGDESFCTLEAFKEAADSFTPKNWKQQCRMNLGKPAMPPVVERPPGV